MWGAVLPDRLRRSVRHARLETHARPVGESWLVKRVIQALKTRLTLGRSGRCRRCTVDLKSDNREGVGSGSAHLRRVLLVRDTAACLVPALGMSLPDRF